MAWVDYFVAFQTSDHFCLFLIFHRSEWLLSPGLKRLPAQVRRPDLF
jgi:hypothetical protein